MAGLRDPRSISRNIDARGRVVAHYGGPPVRYTTHPDPNRCGCRAVWKSWQNYHMSPGWAGTKGGGQDIAYTGGVCLVGHALAGRGAGVKSAGTGLENPRRYAIVFLLGAGQTPSREQYEAFAWWVVTLRKSDGVDPYGNQAITCHRDHMSTACPGDIICGQVKAGRLQPTRTSQEDDMPTAQEIAEAVWNYQVRFNGLTERQAATMVMGDISYNARRAIKTPGMTVAQLRAELHAALAEIDRQDVDVDEDALAAALLRRIVSAVDVTRVDER